MTNKYPARCECCGSVVPANGGTLKRKGRRWIVKHLACAKERAPSVTTVTLGDKTYIRNSHGRCEDAPCCGCCTI
jgi:hypothetical protein